jgi:hypothetical protein
VLRAGDAFHWLAGHTFFTHKDAEQDCVLIKFRELADVKAMEKAKG